MMLGAYCKRKIKKSKNLNKTGKPKNIEEYLVGKVKLLPK